MSEPGSKNGKKSKIKGDSVLPQEQKIQMTGEKVKEGPYRKCTIRESGLQRGLEKRDKVGEPLQRERSGRGK